MSDSSLSARWKKYVQIHLPSDVVHMAFDEKGNRCPVQGSLIDVSGFDIFKFVKLLSSSNPTTIEWLTTDIVYYGTQNEVLRRFAVENFNKTSLYHHYKSMCRNNYLKYLKAGEGVTYKKYLYAMRGLVNARWVVLRGTVPPIIFTDALDGMKDAVPRHITKKLRDIIALKKKGKEKDIVSNIRRIDSYIESFLHDESEAPTEKSHATLTMLNAELRRIVLQS